MSEKVPLENRFWSNVDIKSDLMCWNWIGKRNGSGYGIISVGNKPKIASRVSWWFHYGEISSSELVLHKCDNPPCVNPKHLYLGNHHDNMMDCVLRGRHIFKNKTHCPRGHKYSIKNIYLFRGRRSCKKCHSGWRRRKNGYE